MYTERTTAEYTTGVNQRIGSLFSSFHGCSSWCPCSCHWTTSLCGCFDDFGNCCMTFCCPCITFGRNAEIIDQGIISCCGACCIFALLAEVGCACLYSCTYRSKLRQQYSLPDQPCGDCCVHFFCAYCALCQEHRELNNRGFDPSAGWASHGHRMNAPNTVSGMSRN